jgi:NitT/TauT family transport system permease protein
MAFVLPVLIWSIVSYCPFVWHPQIKITDKGGSSYLSPGQQIDRDKLDAENARLAKVGKPPASGYAANPIFLPAPHLVAFAFFKAFTTPPAFRNDPWLHEALWHSIQIIFWGFITSAIIGVPLGILCGTFDLCSKLFEPFVDFVRYMPAPAFGALCVAVLGIDDGPKIAIIWIGTFFQMVLVVANTTRQLDVGLLEAAQTLGARKATLLSKVILPGILPNLFNDMRILIGWAWTYLIVAELIGRSSGISYFIYQQGRYRHFENVYAGMLMIGIIGLAFDQVLAAFGKYLFPYLPGSDQKTWINAVFGALTFYPQRIIEKRSIARADLRTAEQAKNAPIVPAQMHASAAPNVMDGAADVMDGAAPRPA